MACANGASVKSGVDPNQLVPVDRSLWESVTGTPASWLDPILDTFTQEWIKTSDLCALNLSDPSLPSTADLIAAATNPATIPASLYTWVRDKLRYVQFANQCSCNGNPSGSCTENTYNPLTFTHAQSVGDWGSGTWYSDLPRPPAGQHHLKLTFGGSAPSGMQAWTLYAVVAGEAYYLARFQTYTTLSWEGDVPTSETGMRMENPFLLASTVTMRFQWSNTSGEPPCGATPTPPTAPAQPTQPPTLTLPPTWICGSTADLCTRLQQMDQRLRSIQEYVTLIQRQRAPFAYVSGASFTASGTGSHAVEGILGLSVAFSALPSGRSNYPDNPASYFDLGWLSLCTADGCETARPLHRQNELILDVSPAVTSVRWSLPSGAAATITPLVREP